MLGFLPVYPFALWMSQTWKLGPHNRDSSLPWKDRSLPCLHCLGMIRWNYPREFSSHAD